MIWISLFEKKKFAQKFGPSYKNGVSAVIILRLHRPKLPATNLLFFAIYWRIRLSRPQQKHDWWSNSILESKFEKIRDDIVINKKWCNVTQKEN